MKPRPISILRNTGNLNWDVLYLGWKKYWVSSDDVIAFSVDWLQRRPGETSYPVALLAGSERYDRDEVSELLARCVAEFGQRADQELVELWRFAQLSALHNNSDISDEAKLDQLELIYADFGYPSDMRACSRYYVPNAGIACPFESLAELVQRMAERYSRNNEI